MTDLHGTVIREIRERVQNFHTNTGATTGFRAEASTSSIYLYDAIGGWDGIQATDVIQALSGLGDVSVHINSGGGDIFEGVAIHNAFKNHRGVVTMYIDGVAASAASFIAMAGARIVIEPNATMMIHDGHGLVAGNAKDMRDAADVLDMLSDTIADMYIARTGKGTTKEWRKKMSTKDSWYNAQQALDEGLVDEIAGSSASNTLDLSIFNYLSAATPLAGFASLLKEALK